MITHYEITLSPDRPCTPRPEWGYQLYAAFLSRAPDSFAFDAHRNAITPLSQFLTVAPGPLVWAVSLLGWESEQCLSELLDCQKSLHLQKEHVILTVTDCRKKTIQDLDELFSAAINQGNCHLLRFKTPTAFKSRGQYINLPTSRLIVQSLVRKWNGCFPECPIEDEDDQGIQTIAEGLRYRRFQLRNQMYSLKGNPVPGFIGEMVLENCLSGFHKQLANALLMFSGYAGIGIKTALGMGGIQHQIVHI